MRGIEGGHGIGEKGGGEVEGRGGYRRRGKGEEGMYEQLERRHW